MRKSWGISGWDGFSGVLGFCVLFGLVVLSSVTATAVSRAALGDAPAFEKYYAGGMGLYGIRGFDYRGVSTRGSSSSDPIGSDWIFLANAEVTVPLVSDNLSAMFFVDTGAVDSGGLRASIGIGIQIMLPQEIQNLPHLHQALFIRF